MCLSRVVRFLRVELGIRVVGRIYFWVCFRFYLVEIEIVYCLGGFEDFIRFFINDVRVFSFFFSFGLITC